MWYNNVGIIDGVMMSRYDIIIAGYGNILQRYVTFISEYGIVMSGYVILMY